MASFVALALFCISAVTASVNAQKASFSVDLLHRDSPDSPFYNPNETPSQRLANAIRRSSSRVSHFSPNFVSTNVPKSEIISNQGEYLMRLWLGTPRFKILATADTGSDLIWTQCKPCQDCYKQDDPIFNPRASKTYRDLTCSSRACSALSQSSCSSSGRVCQYQYQYGDQSYTFGNVAIDTVSLESTSGAPYSHPRTVIGCGHNNGGTFNSKGSGIIGLGRGSLSLVSQIRSDIAGKFSYCLVPFGSTRANSSALNFGAKAIVSGRGAQSTPMFTKTGMESFYFLELEAVTVGRTRVEYFTGSSKTEAFGDERGNIIIDSGTTLTLVSKEFFNKLASVVDKAVKGGQRVDDPNNTLQLCYTASSNLRFPTITANFKGANVELKPMNTFVLVSEDVVCFTFNPSEITSDIGGIYGNLAQMNFLVGYDLQKKTVSFKPTDCTRA